MQIKFNKKENNVKIILNNNSNNNIFNTYTDKKKYLCVMFIDKNTICDDHDFKRVYVNKSEL